MQAFFSKYANAQGSGRFSIQKDARLGQAKNSAKRLDDFAYDDWKGLFVALALYEQPDQKENAKKNR